MVHSVGRTDSTVPNQSSLKGESESIPAHPFLQPYEQVLVRDVFDPVSSNPISLEYLRVTILVR
jgi:hypothetical protein